jgi:3-hydroxy acid dehydrogenase/malonic semialdehyde reductase
MTEENESAQPIHPAMKTLLKDKVYTGMNPLVAEDIAEILVWVASRPSHVNIDELLVKSVDQAAMHKIYRRR